MTTKTTPTPRRGRLPGSGTPGRLKDTLYVRLPTGGVERLRLLAEDAGEPLADYVRRLLGEE